MRRSGVFQDDHPVLTGAVVIMALPVVMGAWPVPMMYLINLADEQDRVGHSAVAVFCRVLGCAWFFVIYPYVFHRISDEPTPPRRGHVKSPHAYVPGHQFDFATQDWSQAPRCWWCRKPLVHAFHLRDEDARHSRQVWGVDPRPPL